MFNPVLNVTSIATVGEATGEPTDQSKATIHLPQQQRPRVRGDVAAVETSHHRSPFNRFKFEQRRATSVCIGAILDSEKLFSQTLFSILRMYLFEK